MIGGTAALTGFAYYVGVGNITGIRSGGMKPALCARLAAQSVKLRLADTFAANVLRAIRHPCAGPVDRGGHRRCGESGMVDGRR
jgi:hypothetical protein